MPDLRPMLPADVDAATEMILGNDWGVRRDFLAFAASQPECAPMVVEAEGAIIGTGVGTSHGAVGWIGTIFVDPAWRGQGLGRAITQAIIDRLEAAGARTLILVATEDGRRLYSTMGFEVQTRYQILEAPGLTATPGGSPDDATPRLVRAFRPEDLEGMLTLDRAGTGEDRAHVLRHFSRPDTTKVLDRPDGTLDGFVIRAPWGGGATVARSFEAASVLIHERRLKAGPAGRVRVGLLVENADGLARLEEAGFAPQWAAPRMTRGEPMAWQPKWIWGQFNHAMG